MDIKKIISFLNDESVELLINDQELKSFIKSFKKHRSFHFQEENSNINYIFSLKELENIKNKYMNGYLSLEKYLFIISFIENYLLRREKDTIIEEDLFIFLSNEIMEIENMIL